MFFPSSSSPSRVQGNSIIMLALPPDPFELHSIMVTIYSYNDKTPEHDSSREMSSVVSEIPWREIPMRSLSHCFHYSSFFSFTRFSCPFFSLFLLLIIFPLISFMFLFTSHDLSPFPLTPIHLYMHDKEVK